MQKFRVETVGFHAKADKFQAEVAKKATFNVKQPQHSRFFLM